MSVKFSSKIEKFLKKPNYAVFSTVRKDGSIQSSIVWYIYEKGLFRISTTKDRAKYKNAFRNPKVTMVVIDEGSFYKYVQVRGKVVEIQTKGAYDFIDRETKIYMGEDTYPYDPQRKEKRVIITIKPIDYTSVGFRD